MCLIWCTEKSSIELLMNCPHCFELYNHSNELWNVPRVARQSTLREQQRCHMSSIGVIKNWYLFWLKIKEDWIIIEYGISEKSLWKWKQKHSRPLLYDQSRSIFQVYNYIKDLLYLICNKKVYTCIDKWIIR